VKLERWRGGGEDEVCASSAVLSQHSHRYSKALLFSTHKFGQQNAPQIFGELISPLLSPFRHIFGEDKPIHCQLPPGGALANCRSFGGATGPT
jgi:hypothetical protein